jgi:undecaprenyl diphosphate synthase
LSSSAAGTTVDRLRADRLPQHVAIIMDGNGRWAKKRLLNRIMGHEKGADAVRAVVEACREIGIAYLTLYAFSTENWQRPQLEVDTLMALLKKFLENEREGLITNNIRLSAVGELERLPQDVGEALAEVMAATRGNDGLRLILALSYGARAEIVRMVQRIARQAAEGRIAPLQVDAAAVARELYTHDLPDPDLLIRTSGEQRLSNFLLWQLAYTELFFTPTLWPDFGKEEFMRILMDFQQRDRRYGQIENDG